MLARAADLLACLSHKLGKLLRSCPLRDPRRVMWRYPDLPPHETRFTTDDHRPAHPPVVLLVIPSSAHPPSACQAHDPASSCSPLFVPHDQARVVSDMSTGAHTPSGDISNTVMERKRNGALTRA